MPIAASGPLSMSMFNRELGRTINASNSVLASGSTPFSGSLFWLANQSTSLNQTAPHSFSEWYSYSARYTITVSARTQTVVTPSAATCYYRIGAGSWISIGAITVSSGSYSTYGTTITASRNATLSIGFQRADTNTNITFGTGSGSGGTFSGYCGTSSATPFTYTPAATLTQFCNLASTTGYTTC